MQLNTLGLKNFRNINEAYLQFSDNLNIFIGDNGQGKTNIIEAIHFLIEGESFRYGDNSTIIQFGYESAFVRTKLMNNNLDYQISLKISSQRKEILVNEKKMATHLNPLPPIVLFSPESLSVIKESADERRKLIDQLISSISKNGKALTTDFKKALKTRNRLLKDISEGKTHIGIGIQTLESLDEIYFKLAAQLTCQRIKHLTNIKPYIQDSLSKIESLNQKIDYDFTYFISDQKIVENFEENHFNLMKKRSLELRQVELNSGISLVGPQKHDVIFLYNGNDSRFYCSQGQQRSIILAFKIAQIVYHHEVNGFYPVLLLDDVLSELDQNKQSSLVKTLNQIQTQTFLTSTNIGVLKQFSLSLDTAKNSVFKVKNGAITSE